MAALCWWRSSRKSSRRRCQTESVETSSPSAVLESSSDIKRAVRALRLGLRGGFCGRVDVWLAEGCGAVLLQPPSRVAMITAATHAYSPGHRRRLDFSRLLRAKRES